jgi:hypothetical protein
MAQEPTIGNGNFQDIDEIRIAANAMETAVTVDRSPIALAADAIAPDDNDMDGEIERLGGVTAITNGQLFYDGAAVPKGITETVQRNANFANRLDTANMTIGGAGGGAIKMVTSQDEDGDGRNDEDENGISEWRDAAEEAEHQQEIMRQQRAEAWASDTHDFAGQKLTGAEWHEMAKWFQSDENVAAWEDEMMAQTGQTREQVRAMGGKMRRFYELTEMQAHGDKLTPAQQAEFDSLQRDTQVKRGVTVQRQIQENQRSVAPVSNANDANLDGSITERFTQSTSTYEDAGSARGAPISANANCLSATDASRATSITVAGELDGNVAVTSAPPLRAAFNDAAINAGTVAPIAAASAPQLAAATVSASVAMM